MATPQGVNFDRFSEVSGGLIAVTAGGAIVDNGVALVTGWLSNALWDDCVDAITSSWTVCATDPDSSWSVCSTDPDTSWTICD